MFDSPAINTALLGIITSVIVGGIKIASDKAEALSALAKQGLVLAVAVLLVGGLNFFDVATLPPQYQGIVGTIVQTLVVALTAIGSHNVKEGVKEKSEGGE